MPIRTTTPASVSGSCGDTPVSWVAISRVAPKLATSPIAAPTAIRRKPHHRHHPQHVAAARSERHADADLTRLPRDRVSDDAVNADRHEHQPDRCEHAEQHETEPGLRIRELPQVAGQRACERDRDAAVDRPDFVAHG